MPYDNLFTPFNIGGCTIKNRIVMPPMMMGFGRFDGTPTDEMINYYAERAKGGAGLIMTEITRVNDITGAAAFNQLGISRGYQTQPLKKFADKIHECGAKFFVQLHHPGRQNIGLMIGTIPLCVAMDRLTDKFGKLLFKIAPSAGRFLVDKKLVPSSVGPSRVEPSYFSGGRVRALRRREIKKLIADFIAAAARVKEAGCDGAVLHAAHGYLIQQFLSPHTNRRTDEYGGNLKNRMRFLLEIISGIKVSAPGLPVVVRLSVDECYDRLGYTNRGYSLDEGVEMAKILEKAGIDALDVSCASYDTFNYWLEPASFEEGWRTGMIKAVRAAVSLPILAVNLIRTPALAERQIADGVSDFVSLGRPHIADPYFALKAASGREKEIKRCICCLNCFESMQHNAYVGKHGTCAVNPLLGREGKPLRADGDGRLVAVVGGGPAGLTAAELAARRGFKTVLFEERPFVGGQSAMAASEKSKTKIGWAAQDLEYAARLCGADIRLGERATEETLTRLSPYAVIIASGGVPILPKGIEGIDKAFVCSSADIFRKTVEIKGKRVAVIGSGMTGLDTALILAEAGNSVTVIEMADSPAPGMWMQHRDDILPKLAALNAEILTGLKLIKIEDGGIIAENVKSKQASKIAADNVVLAMGVRPETKLYEQIKDKFARVYLVGDAKKPGRIANATASAAEVAELL
ncbi:MAG: NAD(P)/FAD-dependent oxidoreductase [Clostridiales bacterium]|jgi:2,4-dienoyl-CoA reductase-like NADH-dependent reductase (Old Yellow Enzyme family)/thioredoxin reductase|nr:NAD(P)/FAD-dependent oxidoreductase [Clostridiales bacterium]